MVSACGCAFDLISRLLFSQLVGLTLCLCMKLLHMLFILVVLIYYYYYLYFIRYLE
jgi:hypothetical protein